MKAVVVYSANDLRVADIDRPRCGANDVLVKLEWGGICGSDIAYWRSGVSGTAVLREPLILGHEVAGRIVEIGNKVKNVELGQAVAIYPATLVGEYDLPEEMRERSNLWPEVRYFGSAAFLPHEQGGFCEYRVVRPEQLRFLPDSVSLKDGALAEPFAVAIHAVRRAGAVDRKTVLVNGAGPIGALAVAAAKAFGAAKVVAADLSPNSLRIAKEMGADEVVNLAANEILPTDVDVTIEASGASIALGDVFAATRRGGVVVQVGNLPGNEVKAVLGNIVTREIDYRGSYRFVNEMESAISLMNGYVDLAPIQTHDFVLTDAVAAFETAADRSTLSSKVMLKLSHTAA